MDNHPPGRDYSLLAPLLIGTISLLGICLILLSIWSTRQNAPQSPTQTVTPIKYLVVATRTPIHPVEPETSAPTQLPSLAVPTRTSTGEATLIVPLTEQTGIPNTDELVTPTLALTPTITLTSDPLFSQVSPLTVGKYDDTDPGIIRMGNWTSQHNVEIAYEKTLLISNTVGNSIAFRFTGQRIVLGYVSSNTAGVMKVNIDGDEVTIPQLVGNAWFSQELASGTHHVILTHSDGASVNLDYIEISG
jgi:hypothetical protein